ncbi:MAG TPA: DUF4124 domain-containing protein [Syntrophales bacterium]|nr:DUF4124 domain-containing protein [Syntrophales bacterium]HOX93677.1 DUF4124 domain-containing protein [Syntrophales bacterium]HPI56585.1 DUF4124 domain-containing protein [Syntrophales bacterium]HPN24994.1 DUF4124 domain-containing protein [Syntrophales bacterium]HQM29264.1 DUF4124 domain-containing protein [Syntrophales bacterium]
MTPIAYVRLKRAGTFCLVILFCFCLAAEAGGQTLYEYKDESGAVVITDKPPAEKVKSVKKREYKQEEPSSPRATGPEEKGMGLNQRGTGALAPASPEDMEKQRQEEFQRYQAEEKSKREEAARRLEQEAMKPVPYSRENVRRQTELLDRAQKIRAGQEPVPAAKQ